MCDLNVFCIFSEELLTPMPLYSSELFEMAYSLTQLYQTRYEHIHVSSVAIKNLMGFT